MSEKFLIRAYVIAVFQKMRREGTLKRVAACRFVHAARRTASFTARCKQTRPDGAGAAPERKKYMRVGTARVEQEREKFPSQYGC